jgi:hypothetical protein
VQPKKKRLEGDSHPKAQSPPKARRSLALAEEQAEPPSEAEQNLELDADKYLAPLPLPQHEIRYACQPPKGAACSKTNLIETTHASHDTRTTSYFGIIRMLWLYSQQWDVKKAHDGYTQ